MRGATGAAIGLLPAVGRQRIGYLTFNGRLARTSAFQPCKCELPTLNGQSSHGEADVQRGFWGPFERKVIEGVVALVQSVSPLDPVDSSWQRTLCQQGLAGT